MGEFIDTEHNGCTLSVTRFYGSQENGVCCQFTINNVYVRLNNEQIRMLTLVLFQCMPTIMFSDLLRCGDNNVQ